MGYKNIAPAITICYTPEDDWLARAIAVALDEKVFRVCVRMLCFHNNDNLRQKIDESLDDCEYFLFVLSTRSIEALQKNHTLHHDLFISISKQCQLVLALHYIMKETFPLSSLAEVHRISLLPVNEIVDVSELVKHIQRMEGRSHQTSKQSQSDSGRAVWRTISDEEKDARRIVSKLLLMPDYRVEIDKIAKTCEWDEDRLCSAIGWFEQRGLAKVEGKFLIGTGPSIECFKHIIFYEDYVRGSGIASVCAMGKDDALLLNREKFKGKIFNKNGNFDIHLTASADRSGKITINVEPTDSIKTGKELLFIFSKDENQKLISTNLACTSIQNKSRELVSNNVRIRYDTTKKPVPIWIEVDKVVIIDRTKTDPILAENTGEMTLCLSEFDCLQLCDSFNSKLGSLTIKYTIEDCDKSRTNDRITAILSLIQKESKVWQKESSIFLKRLLCMLGFAQGGKLFCPLREKKSNGGKKTTFLCHGVPTSQFMPVIQRREDLNNLVKKVIEAIDKKNILDKEKWEWLEKLINFVLSTPVYGEARLLLNLIAIERLVKLFGDKRREKCKLHCKVEFYFKDNSISRDGISNNDIHNLVENRNSLAHEGKMKGEDDVANLLALSHELLSRFILNKLGYKGCYCSYIAKEGGRTFPECTEIDRICDKNAKDSMGMLHYYTNLRRWQSIVKDNLHANADHLIS